MTTQSEQDEIFSGIRVIEIGQYIAAPVAARMMSDMGAEVFKVELPPYGDMMRVVAAPGAPQGTAYISENRGKKSLCIDLKRPEGIAVLRDLVRHSDVLIENFTPGVLAKYGVTYENLKPLNPRLIMCSISGFGQTGPLANKPGNDLIAQAASGFLNLVGERDGTPVYPATNLSDNGAGVHALAAISAALFFRERTGRGQFIDLSLVECMGHYNSLGIVQHGLTGGKAKQTRAGSHSPGAAPFGVFKARDGYIVLTVLIHQWGIFTELIGRPELTSDQRYDTNDHRVERKEELIKIVQDWLQSFPSRDQPLAMLAKAHILSAPVLDTPGFINDAQIRAREFIQTVPQPGFGAIGIPKAPFHFSEAKCEIRRRAPLLGEDNEAVLAAVVGYSEARIAELNKTGVLHRDPSIDKFKASGEL
jgi:crotonobetainyl-CoA:carnitine CoA-transferase CaiB-like acyl-CoA transferase